MTIRREVETKSAEPVPATLRPMDRWYRLVSLLFAHQAMSEAVATRLHFNASPEAVWTHLMLFEEVPGRAPFFLRALLPQPVRTEGDKNCVGTTVRCTYRGGHLFKRITAVEPPSLLQFEVIEQRLGIEGCILTLGGSYQIHPCGDASDVVLITRYRAYLRPRFLWRPLEAFLVGQLHRHILRGVSAAALPGNLGVRPAFADSLKPQCVPPGGLSCTVSPLRSHR
jgi:hypothetical protein